jgi:hypothetical protein
LRLVKVAAMLPVSFSVLRDKPDFSLVKKEESAISKNPG